MESTLFPFFGRASCILAGIGFAVFVFLLPSAIVGGSGYGPAAYIWFSGLVMGIISVIIREETSLYTYGIFFNGMPLLPAIYSWIHGGHSMNFTMGPG